jgi:DNA-binding transcriptional regulator GbsR (MarR family)
MKTLNPAAAGFIEQISLLAESAGFPRIGGRIAGLFIVQVESLSFDELVSLLQISRGNASINIRLRKARGVLRRSCRLGERKDLLDLDSSFPERMIERRLDEQRAILRAARQGAQTTPRSLRAVEGRPQANRGLHRLLRAGDGERSGEVAQGGGDHQPHGARTGAPGTMKAIMSSEATPGGLPEPSTGTRQFMWT